ALFVALPLGAFIAFSISKGFLNLFNIDYEVFQVSRQAITFQVLAAILVPLLAALWPVLSGATITVREAIASYGLGGDFGNSKLDRLVERVAQKILSAPYAIAIGNMFRRKGRLIFTQVALITAGAMVLMVMSLSASINFSLDNETARNDYDTIVFFEDEERIDRVVALAQSLPDVETAEVRFSHSASILRQGQRASEAGIGTQLVGLPNSSDMFQPIVVAGRWLLPEDGRAIVIYEKTAEDNNINLGDTVTLDLNQQGKSDWMVVGLYTQIFSGFGSFDSIYANRDAVFQTIGTYNRGSGLYVRTHSHDEESVNKITEQLKMVYDAENIKVNSTQTALEIRQQADSTFAISISMLFSMAVIVAVVGGVGLMGALSISVVERTREIGVMRAIGARSLTIMGMFMTEGVLQGFFSWFIVVPLSFILARPMADALGQVMFSANLDYRYNLKAVLVWLAIVLIIAMLASIIPARNATRISVRDSLAYQ
ncbi:MAG: ABC transporter permease, partial [Anaerolineae bacterium]